MSQRLRAVAGWGLVARRSLASRGEASSTSGRWVARVNCTSELSGEGRPAQHRRRPTSEPAPSASEVVVHISTSAWLVEIACCLLQERKSRWTERLERAPRVRERAGRARGAAVGWAGVRQGVLGRVKPGLLAARGLASLRWLGCARASSGAPAAARVQGEPSRRAFSGSALKY